MESRRRPGKPYEKKGHHVLGEDEPINQVGGGQAVYLDRDQDVLLGASDRRKDGCAWGIDT